MYLISWLVFQDFECFILRFRRRWNSAVGGEPPQWQVFSKFIILSHKIKKGKKTPHQQYRNIISTISSSNLKKHSVFTSFHQNNDFPLELIVLDILIQGNTFSKYHITIHCIALHCALVPQLHHHHRGHCCEHRDHRAVVVVIMIMPGLTQNWEGVY